MANTVGGNVIFVDTSAAFDYCKNIDGVKLLGGSAGSSITIRADTSIGNILWQGLSSVGVVFDEVEIRSDGGIYVVVAGAATALIYQKIC